MLPLELAGIDEAGSIAERFLAEVGLQDRLGHFPPRCLGVSSSESPLPGLLRESRRYCSPMNPPGTLIPAPASALLICCLSSMPVRARHWCSSPMMSDSPSVAIGAFR